MFKKENFKGALEVLRVELLKHTDDVKKALDGRIDTTQTMFQECQQYDNFLKEEFNKQIETLKTTLGNLINEKETDFQKKIDELHKKIYETAMDLIVKKDEKSDCFTEALKGLEEKVEGFAKELRGDYELKLKELFCKMEALQKELYGLRNDLRSEIISVYRELSLAIISKKEDVGIAELKQKLIMPIVQQQRVEDVAITLKNFATQILAKKKEIENRVIELQHRGQDSKEEEGKLKTLEWIIKGVEDEKKDNK